MKAKKLYFFIVPNDAFPAQHGKLFLLRTSKFFLLKTAH